MSDDQDYSPSSSPLEEDEEVSDMEEEPPQQQQRQLTLRNRNLGGGTVHTDLHLVQQRLNVVGNLESPVPKPVPADQPFHQFITFTLSKNVLPDPPMLMFATKHNSASADAYRMLFDLLCRMTRRAGYTTAPNNRRRGAGEPLIDHRMAGTGLYRIYPYMEMLPSASSTAENWIFGGMRAWFFLMDAQKDFGKLLVDTIKDNQAESPLYSESLPDQVEGFLIKVLSYYLQEDFEHLDEASHSLLKDLSSLDSLAGDRLDDPSNRFHPANFFNARTAMSLHTEGIHPRCKTLSNYFEGNVFRGFPLPQLVSYIPAHQFSDPRVLLSIPLQNAWTQQQLQEQTRHIALLRTNAFNQREMQDGFDDLSRSLVHDAVVMSLDQPKRMKRKEILTRVEKVDQVCFTPNKRKEELYKLPVVPNAWPIYERSDLLQLRLHQTGFLGWMNNEVPISHPEYYLYETYRQKKALGEFQRIMREGTVPGPWTEMRQWFFSLDARKQLFSIDHTHPYLSSYGNLKIWIYWCIENVLKIHTNHAPMYFLYLMSCAVGDFVLELKGMHTHVELTGNPGSGKSVLFSGIATVSAPGLVKSYSHQTNLAFTTDDDKSTNSLIIYHDAPAFLRGDSKRRGSNTGGHDGTETHNAPMMTGMSEGIITTLEYNQDREKGDPRSNVTATASFQSSVAVGNNESVQGPMEDRMSTMPISSKHRWDKSMSDAGEGGSEFTEEKPVMNEFIHQMRVLCCLCFIVLKAEEGKVIPPVNMSVFEQFKKDLQNEIKRRTEREVDSRAFKRMRNMVKSATILNAIMKTLMSEPAEFTWRRDKATGKFRPFDFNSIPFVARDLVATSEIVLDIFTLMRDEFLPSRSYMVAKAILTGFDLADPSRPGNYGSLFIGEDGRVDPNYYAVEWKPTQTPSMIDKELGSEHVMGSKNVERELTHMHNTHVYEHPMMFADPVREVGRLSRDTSQPKRYVSLACFKHGKASAHAKATKRYLCVHVTALEMNMEEETKDIIRTVWEYSGVPPEGQTVVTSFPVNVRDVPIKTKDGGERKVDVTMYQLFQTMHLKHSSRELRIENPNTYSRADMVLINTVRRHLKETTKFRPNLLLDQIRKEAVFKEEDNIDMRAMVEHWEKLGVKLDSYSGIVYPREFAVAVKTCREANRRRYPKESEIDNHDILKEECIEKIKNLHGLEAGNNLRSRTEVLRSLEKQDGYLDKRQAMMRRLNGAVRRSLPSTSAAARYNPY